MQKKKEKVPSNVQYIKEKMGTSGKLALKDLRTSLRNIVSEKPKPKPDKALAHSPQISFEHFINESLITIIITWTNQKIKQLRDRLKSRQGFAYDTENIEIKAIIEILFLRFNKKFT